ncbi:molybdopterin molybdotransferase MoeA [Caldichromatium japonicum]|uniref:Molybdopterin molybdenumtransferase n=1 Tax=Caldichromatium japonicum TaxID=2699430 RepID=A0A6G7VGA5_9GAMM|nr:gephyrin-like molybdotransferase Glp [Caldichromatium japonicum]QIK38878.1 molybdopterin molybdotransferase MoeA [Caldichromatium japonicum]
MSQTSCTSKPKALTLDQAVARLIQAVQPLTETETVALADALGRVLAEPVRSAIDVPPWDNSAMDGYTIRISDLAASGGCLPIAQRIPAGHMGEPLALGTAARIFTGAPIPDGADTVVIQEVCRESAGEVQIPLDIQVGANIRRRGEDIREGSTVLAAGTRLSPQHLGLAASIGCSALQVYRRLRVAILTTGDEIVEPGVPLQQGQIYNSNWYLLAGLLRHWGCEVLDLGIVHDDLGATVAALNQASKADLIIASGGASVGDKDHLRPAVEQLGQLEFSEIRIRPGKPVAFGRVGQTPILGCPGNPVSLFVTALLFARPLIRRLQGIDPDHPPRLLPVRAAFDWPKPDRRMEFHRARLVRLEDGELGVEVYPSRSSAVLSSVVWADGFVQLEPERVLQRGDRVEFLPFSELLS